MLQQCSLWCRRQDRLLASGVVAVSWASRSQRDRVRARSGAADQKSPNRVEVRDRGDVPAGGRYLPRRWRPRWPRSSMAEARRQLVGRRPREGRRASRQASGLACRRPPGSVRRLPLQSAERGPGAPGAPAAAPTPLPGTLTSRRVRAHLLDADAACGLRHGSLPSVIGNARKLEPAA